MPLRMSIPVKFLNLENPAVSTASSSCRHCRWRRAQQTRRHRLRGVDLFEWAGRQ
jgi:hypothetical protein